MASRVRRKEPKSKALLEQLHALVQQLYSTHERRIRPKYPWVFVKVLPKEQKPLGTIILPGGIGPGGQNKILYEGIVLETWKPFWKHYRTNVKFSASAHAEYVEETEQLVESSVKPDDHVLFPHYEGLPAGHIFDEKEYRLVREINPSDPERRCEIISTLDYDRETIEQALVNVIESTYKEPIRLGNLPELVARITKEFYVVRKHAEVKTVTGV